MENKKTLNYLKEVLDNMPTGWLNLTTHRLDIYNEELAKVEFLQEFERLFNGGISSSSALESLPTAYDYIRLGHPLSCILEWALAKLNGLKPESVISFSSKVMPIMAVLRKNLLEGKSTQINYTGELPPQFDAEILRDVYGYSFDLNKVENAAEVTAFEGSALFLSQQMKFAENENASHVDFFITGYAELGSILYVNGTENEDYISDIQHLRRRETVAMTPSDCLAALQSMTQLSPITEQDRNGAANKTAVLQSISKITHAHTVPLVASSGLSIQYAIMMGLVHHALENHKGKAIKIIVPPNCYGGTNDQARRLVACVENAEVVDLPVDGGNDMVKSIDMVLEDIAQQDAIPYIIAEIPTNPRVEVPDLKQLRAVLSAPRKTTSGAPAIDPVFILDQTFCPNVNFLGDNETLSSARTISYSSGSKFPTGGKSNAGYCVGNKKAEALMNKIETHLVLCNNEATDEQMEILAEQLPSMNQRIQEAYENTREFVHFIQEILPEAKINFVSDELAKDGFTPSVFSLDLPTKGATEEEKEAHKRALNHTLISMMISEIPDESKHCVSYGQLKGCYWTIPATSTQGTTKESDKDYIARVAMSPEMDVERHKQVFRQFVENI